MGGDVQAVFEGRAQWALVEGDCLDVFHSLPDACVDAVVTDPPAGISFMGKGWDSDKGGRDTWIAWLSSVMAECLRVLKPGSHGLVWALPRTSHWTAMALEEAGFEIRDRIAHLFGSGFPKSLDVSKAIDKAAGCVRPRVPGGCGSPVSITTVGLKPGEAVSGEAISGEAIQWQGWGTALKPAVEDWWLVRKPLEGTVAANVLEYGTGAINIDGCRVAGVPRSTGTVRPHAESGVHGIFGSDPRTDRQQRYDANKPDGRWPAHLVLSHTPECRCVGTRRIASSDRPGHEGKQSPVHVFGPEHMHSETRHADADGKETVEAWECAPDCPARLLDEQSGEAGAFAPVRGTEPSAAVEPGTITGARDRVPGAFHADSGGASRFFYTAKAARSERDAGLAHLPASTGGQATGRKDGSAGLDSPRAGAGRHGGARNTHPTVKSLDLMQWLCRLITPPGGIVLDPFAGSGSALVAALREGFRVIGVEREPQYVTIARARVEEDAPLFYRPRSMKPCLSG